MATQLAGLVGVLRKLGRQRLSATSHPAAAPLNVAPRYFAHQTETELAAHRDVVPTDAVEHAGLVGVVSTLGRQRLSVRKRGRQR